MLFVDDEPAVLNGLKMLLRKQRSAWDMAFATSGEAALELLAQQPRDLVVTDMRMPGMDGAELLGRVRERHPRTARLILSGQANRDDLMRARRVAQQILSKPCDRATLCEAIERVFTIQALVDNERIHTLVGHIDRLPLRAVTHRELTQAAADPARSPARLTRIVERDPALSMTVLSLVNAGHMGPAPADISLANAVERLGYDRICELTSSSGMFSHVDTSLIKSRTLANLPQMSLLKARLAREFVSDPNLSEEAFATALMLDIGYIALAQDGVDAYLPQLEQSASDYRPLHDIEQEQLGFTHADVSACLLGIWGLPTRMVQLVACHHPPALLGVTTNPVAAAVHVADVLVDAMRINATDVTSHIAPEIREQPAIRQRLADWRSVAQTAAAAS